MQKKKDVWLAIGSLKTKACSTQDCNDFLKPDKTIGKSEPGACDRVASLCSPRLSLLSLSFSVTCSLSRSLSLFFLYLRLFPLSALRPIESWKENQSKRERARELTPTSVSDLPASKTLLFRSKGKVATVEVLTDDKNKRRDTVYCF